MAAADGEEVVDVVGVFCLDARLDTPEAVVVLVVDVVAVVEEAGAVVAGGATTVPLFRPTAPKDEVTVDRDVDDVEAGVGADPATAVLVAACPLVNDLGAAPFVVVGELFSEDVEAPRI